MFLRWGEIVADRNMRHSRPVLSRFRNVKAVLKIMLTARVYQIFSG